MSLWKALSDKELPDPPAMPTAPLWRYMDSSKFFSILEYQKLFFPAAISLPDKAEGLAYNKKSLVMMKALRSMMDKTEGASAKGLIKEKMPEETENEIQEYRKHFVLINSWHSSEHESYGMWKAYISGPEGVCIKTTAEKLGKCFSVETDVNLKPQVKPVTYGQRIKYAPEYLSHFLRKAKPYAFEQEVRAVVDLIPVYGSKSEKWEEEQFKNLLMDKGLYIKIAPKELIEKIVVSPFSPPWFIRLVKNMIKRYELDEGLVEESELHE